MNSFWLPKALSSLHICNKQWFSTGIMCPEKNFEILCMLLTCESLYSVNMSNCKLNLINLPRRDFTLRVLLGGALGWGIANHISAWLAPTAI